MLTVTAAMVTGLAAQVSPASAVVGGQQATAGQFPSVVNVLISGWHGYEHKCGGVLLGTKSVLTTAGCVDGHTASEFKIQYDGTDRTSLRVTQDVSTIHEHEDYPSTLRNNVAVLTLKNPIQTSDTVGVASLPQSGADDPLAGRKVDLAGWGATRRGTAALPVQLHHATMPVISHAACTSAYGAGPIDAGLFCAKAQAEKFACQGDAGSPVYIGNKVVGLVTAKNGCTHPGKPDVYVRVGALERWITSKVM
ncbi:hypothetical protein B1H19_02260 [Streptomyces gilvosporeus]|uniref:Peptidase S1 domain-containing protein n=1 Tax=Streptomyces gilvosporeus TaxID=553510 RepID=A0A1V0TK27_9ACTN|nr:hypothetical protein B1H19_02260 [Streptomyces gilvosporeus]